MFNQQVIQKVEKIAIVLFIIFLPLSRIPEKYTLPFLGPNVSMWFFFIAFLFLCYEYFKFHFEIPKYFAYWLLLFVIWQIVCLIHGLYSYEYNSLLTLTQLPKLVWLTNEFPFLQDFVEDIHLIKLFYFFKTVKGVIFVNCNVFILMFMIFHLYKDNFKNGFSDIRIAGLFLFTLLGSYSVFELAWIKFGADWGKSFLETVNPLLYDVQKFNGWWPPLLWPNQLRSLAMEPSFFGIISILLLPFLWSFLLYKKNKLLSIFILLYFTIMVMATNSRTAIVLTGIQAILLLLSGIIIRKKSFVYAVLLVSGIFFTSYFINLVDFNNKFDSTNSLNKNEQVTNSLNKNEQVTNSLNKNERVIDNHQNLNKAGDFFSYNILSLATLNSRSNSARFANLVANLNVIIKHPFTGVGIGLQDAYIDQNFSTNAKAINEVIWWKKYFRIQGPLNNSFPHLNALADIAIQNGIVGLFLYLIPLLLLIYFVIKYFRVVFQDLRCVFLLISVIGMFAAQFSSLLFTTTNGILWGLLWCKINKIIHYDDQV